MTAVDEAAERYCLAARQHKLKWVVARQGIFGLRWGAMPAGAEADLEALLGPARRARVDLGADGQPPLEVLLDADAVDLPQQAEARPPVGFEPVEDRGGDGTKSTLLVGEGGGAGRSIADELLEDLVDRAALVQRCEALQLLGLLDRAQAEDARQEEP